MSKITASQAIAEVRKFAKTIKAFEYLEQVADTLAASDQLISERDKVRAKLETDIRASQDEIGALERQKQAAQDNARKSIEAATATASQIFQEARTAADAYQADVEKRVADLLAAEADAAAKYEATHTRLEELKTEFNAMEKRVAKARKDLQQFIGGSA